MKKMKFIPKAIFMVVYFCSVASSQAQVYSAETQKMLDKQIASFRNLPELFEFCRKADRIEVFEGLPDYRLGKAELETEQKRSDVFKLKSSFFYSPALTLPENDKKVLLDETLKESSYIPWQGLRMCDFHADLLIRFTRGDEVVDLQLCFGCSEAHFTGPKVNAHVDIKGPFADKWKEIQKRNQTKRPKTRDDEIY